MRTLATNTDGDLTGTITDGADSLQQRIIQRLRFRRGEWFANPNAGTDRILGHQLPADLAASVITAAIVEEGGDEVVSVTATRVSLDPDTRTLTYHATVESVYGPIPLAEQVR